MSWTRRGRSLPCRYCVLVSGDRGIKIFFQLSDDFLPPSLIVQFLLEEIVLLLGIEGVVDGFVRCFLALGEALRRRSNLSGVTDDHRRVVATGRPEELGEHLLALCRGKVQSICHPAQA